MQVTQSSSSSVYATSATQKTSKVSAYDTSSTQSTQKTDKLAKMEEKYQDIYTPIPETYSKTDEDLQTQKIYEAYPNYVFGQDFLKIVDKYYAQSGAEPLKLGTTSSEVQIKAQEEAFNKAYEEIGLTKESFVQMQKDVQKIKQEHPINQWAKDGVENAKELSKFYNAGVYEGLESGLSIEDAKQASSSAIYSYMGTSANKVMLRAMPNEELGLDGSELFNNYVKYEKQSYNYDTNIDLRESNIEGWWRDNNVYQNDSAMISEIQKKISQFNFMLNNSSPLQEAIDKLDPNSRPEISSLQNIINNEELPEENLALKIFQNYNIYDSIDIKG